MVEDGDYKVYGYRWVVLAVFGLVMMAQAFLWLSFAPIEKGAQRALGMNPTMIGLLALVGPFMFIILSSPAGALADSRGFKFSVGIGVGLLMLAGVVKAVVAYTVDSTTAQYWIYLFMQILGGAGAVFAMVNLSKMPIKWFPVKQRALANGLTTMSMYLGSAIGLVLVTAVASIPDKAKVAEIPLSEATSGLDRVLVVMAIIMAVVGVLFYVFAKEKPPTSPGPAEEEIKVSLKEALPRFMRSGTFRVLCLVSLVGYGVYIALTVTMEKIVAYHGHGTSFAAWVASGITIGGIIGAAVLPGLSEKVGLRKPFLILAAAVAVPALLVLAFVGNGALVITAGAVMGFFLLPALPVTFTIVGEMDEIGPTYAATAVGTLLALGSIGSVCVPLLVRAIGSDPPKGTPDFRWSLVTLAGLTLVALVVVVLFVKETGPKARQAEEE